MKRRVDKAADGTSFSQTIDARWLGGGVESDGLGSDDMTIMSRRIASTEAKAPFYLLKEVMFRPIPARSIDHHVDVQSIFSFGSVLVPVMTVQLPSELKDANPKDMSETVVPELAVDDGAGGLAAISKTFREGKRYRACDE